MNLAGSAAVAEKRWIDGPSQAVGRQPERLRDGPELQDCWLDAMAALSRHLPGVLINAISDWHNDLNPWHQAWRRGQIRCEIPMLSGS